MRTKKFLFVGSALVLAAAFGRCSGGTTTTPDGGVVDMATSVDVDMATVPGQPTLTSISPPTAPNTGGTTVTITGTNFMPGATVTIGGVAATQVNVVSSTQITCVVPAKAATCGLAVAQVTNTDSKMGSSATLFTYRSAAFSFAAPAALGMANTTRYVIAADLDNDGDLDLVSANSGLGAGNLTVRLNNGNGTYAAATTVALGGMSPYAVAAGYIDGDTKLDLIAVRNAGNDITIRLGVGDGTFTTPAVGSVSTGSAGPTDLAIGDLDGDGKSDVLVASTGSSDVSTLISNGNGTFKAATITTTGMAPSAVLLANFDQGGKLDFATADKNGNTATVKLGNGQGGFGVGSAVMNVTAPSDLVAGDFNGDGVLDLAVASSGTRTIRVTIGVGDGTFNPAQGSTPLAGTTLITQRSVAAGDFNLDGNLDIAVSNQGDRNVSILLGQGNGSFMAKQDFALTLTADPTMITAADLNKDGILDLVTTDQLGNGVVVLLSQCQ